MEINVTFDRPAEGPKAGPVMVGWFLTSDKGAVLYDPPERLIFRQTNRRMRKAQAAARRWCRWKAGISW